MRYIILIIIGFLIYYYYLSRKKDLVEGLNTFNGRMAIDDQYFYDQLFDDVIYYPNQYDKDYKTGEEIGKLISTGWARCKEECPGHCVEFGLSGHSYCFNY